MDSKKHVDDKYYTKDTKRKAGWDNSDILALIDNYILKKQPTKASELVSLLQSYFAAGGVGRTTVIHHIKKRENELKNKKSNCQTVKIIHPSIAASTSEEQTFTESEEENVAESVPSKAKNTNDPCELLNKQIENIQQQLNQPQTIQNSDALKILLKSLINAKQEFLKKLSISEETIPSLAVSANASSTKITVPRGKRKIENFHFGFNEKLTKNLLIIFEDEKNVREFSLERTYNETKYYTCCKCRNFHDRQKKENKQESVKKCRAIVLPSGEVFMDKIHDKKCQVISKVESDNRQAKRIKRLREGNEQQNDERNENE